MTPASRRRTVRALFEDGYREVEVLPDGTIRERTRSGELVDEAVTRTLKTERDLALTHEGEGAGMTEVSVSGRSSLSAYLSGPLTVGDPDVAGPLAVCPIFGTTCAQPFASSAQAARDETLVVKEVEEAASVTDLIVTNVGDAPVLLCEGEELLGGQQNRTLDASVLLGQGTTVKVPVTCVEEGRWDWSRRREAVATSPQSLSPDLRRTKSRSADQQESFARRAQADQQEVWREMDALFGRHRS